MGYLLEDHSWAGEFEASAFLIRGISAKIIEKKLDFKMNNLVHERLKIQQKSLVTLLHATINHPILAPFIGNLI